MSAIDSTKGGKSGKSFEESHLRDTLASSKANCADDNCIDDDADDFTTCSDSLKSRSLPLILQESEFWQVISK